ncbi:MAG: flagellar motor switch protein FliM [Syntrophomonadaceae bacterium]|nr:flagellar motor switch protein FliM [Syntrophomonadaceae bacterium]
MSEVLSQTEIDALLAALTSGSVNVEDLKEEEKKKKIRVYNFKRPNKFSKDQLNTLSNIYENYARSLTTYLSALLRTIVQINVLSVEQLTYEEFIRSIPDPSIINVVSMDPLPGNMILEISPSVSFMMLDRVFGGAGQVPEKVRSLTEIERTVMELMGQKIVDLFREAWATIVPLSPRIEFIESNPQFTQITSPSEMVVLISLETRIFDSVGVINICIPYITLEPIISKLSVQFWYSTAARERSPESIDELRKRVEKAYVPVRIILGYTTVTVAELLELQVGDVISLETRIDQPLEVLIGHRAKFTGRPGLVGNRLGLQITSVLRNDNGEDEDE